MSPDELLRETAKNRRTPKRKVKCAGRAEPEAPISRPNPQPPAAPQFFARPTLSMIRMRPGRRAAGRRRAKRILDLKLKK